MSLDRLVAGLRQTASYGRNWWLTYRLLAAAHWLDGALRVEAASACGMDRQLMR